MRVRIAFLVQFTLMLPLIIRRTLIFCHADIYLCTMEQIALLVAHVATCYAKFVAPSHGDQDCCNCRLDGKDRYADCPTLCCGELSLSLAFPPFPRPSQQRYVLLLYLLSFALLLLVQAMARESLASANFTAWAGAACC